MADERRRQLRSQRILQNSESRRQKILGINKNQDDSKEEVGPRISSFATSTPISSENVDPTGLKYSPKTPVTSRTELKVPFRHTNLQDDTNKDDDPLLHDSALRNLLKKDCFEDTDAEMKSSNGTHAASAEEQKRSALMPIFLALVVCWCLAFGFGDVVFNSLSYPLILYEVHYILISLYHSRNQETSSFGTLEAFLSICGINPKLINMYNKVSSLLYSVFDDVALYLIVVVMWQYAFKLSTDHSIEADGTTD